MDHDSGARPVTFFLAAEDRRQLRVLRRLVDDLACARGGWVEAELLAIIRRWVGLEDRGGDPGGAADEGGDTWFPIGDAMREARERGKRIHGHIDGRPGGPEAPLYRAVLALAQLVERDAVVIARDLDGHPERRQGFLQIMQSSLKPGFPVVFAWMEPESEAWIVAGFEPEDARERKALAELHEELGFWPHREPHRLTSSTREPRRDAKRVLRALTGDDEDRNARCLGDRERLKERGEGCGVAAFIAEAEKVLVPLILGQPAEVPSP